MPHSRSSTLESVCVSLSQFDNVFDELNLFTKFVSINRLGLRKYRGAWLEAWQICTSRNYEIIGRINEIINRNNEIISRINEIVCHPRSLTMCVWRKHIGKNTRENDKLLKIAAVLCQGIGDFGFRYHCWELFYAVIVMEMRGGDYINISHVDINKSHIYITVLHLACTITATGGVSKESHSRYSGVFSGFKPILSKYFRSIFQFVSNISGRHRLFWQHLMTCYICLSRASLISAIDIEGTQSCCYVFDAWRACIS